MPRSVVTPNEMKSTPPMTLTALSLTYFSSRPPLSTASKAATVCPMQPPRTTPIGLRVAASVTVANMDLSPHSARKIKTEKRNQSMTKDCDFDLLSWDSISHSASSCAPLHSGPTSSFDSRSRKDWMPKKIMSKPAASRTQASRIRLDGRLLSITPMEALSPVITQSAESAEESARIRPLRIASIMVRKKVLSPISLMRIVVRASPIPLKAPCFVTSIAGAK
mmetsp:Transcript_20031/g.35648  ORF Transcript_20031/g.35648 Transcript_20031/m.35648 type:complete len:222 (+) Transcript_20031:92-757(+)